MKGKEMESLEEIGENYLKKKAARKNTMKALVTCWHESGAGITSVMVEAARIEVTSDGNLYFINDQWGMEGSFLGDDWISFTVTRDALAPEMESQPIRNKNNGAN
jgi:hypothetical protein